MRGPSVILMGSKPGSVVALSMLLGRGWDIRAVVVLEEHYQPWTAGPTLGEFARQNGLPCFVQSELPRTGRADFVLSYMYRKLVKADVLALADRAALNFHAAPLPELGGFGCYNRAVLNNSTEFGTTCHYMDRDFDTGDILRVTRFPIDPRAETALSVERKAQEEMIRLFHDFCILAESGEPLPRTRQDRSKSEYWTEDALQRMKEIPDGADAETIDRYARAFWYPPYEGAQLRVDGHRVAVMPRLVGDQLAAALHGDDFARLSGAPGMFTKS